MEPEKSNNKKLTKKVKIIINKPCANSPFHHPKPAEHPVPFGRHPTKRFLTLARC